MSEWQPIETAPKDGTLVDLWVVPKKRWDTKLLGIEPGRATDMQWINGKWWTDYQNWLWRGSLNANREATHWVLSPAPPTPKGYRR